mmetsp:Transcript_16849/g.22280  ORF Transcript_16849/g.22280 Transcript_16849/m.22280 type:complete len:147 (+) Transcript_16849:38-478(+)
MLPWVEEWLKDSHFSEFCHISISYPPTTILHNMSFWNKTFPTILVVIYAAIFLGSLSETLISFPLTEFATDDLDWTRSWFYATLVDYYGVALCLCIVIFSTEKLFAACLWSAGILFLGCWVGCGWIFYRLKIKGGIYGKNWQPMTS